MSCHATEYYRLMNPLLERIETLSRLNVCIDSDEELSWTQAMLLSMITDYTVQLRRVLHDLTSASPEEEASA